MKCVLMEFGVHIQLYVLSKFSLISQTCTRMFTAWRVLLPFVHDFEKPLFSTFWCVQCIWPSSFYLKHVYTGSSRIIFFKKVGIKTNIQLFMYILCKQRSILGKKKQTWICPEVVLIFFFVVKEFLTKAKEDFTQKWDHPTQVDFVFGDSCCIHVNTL